MGMKKRLILTPCPPKKRCPVCEARLNEVFGSADHLGKYSHQAGEAGKKAINALAVNDDLRAVQFACRAGSFANLALG
jgi:hypothetical protein